MMNSLARDAEASSESRSSKSNGTANGAAHAVECGACRQANGRDRRFCTKCGESLWRKCLKCGTECAGGEVFCGNCGAKYQELVAARLTDIETAIRRANEFRANGDHGQALQLLRSLPDAEQLEIRGKLAEARQLATDLAQERSRLEQEAEEATQQAEKWMAQRKYKEVVVRLQSVPSAFRTDRGRQLLESADSAYREIKSLRTSIAADVEARRLFQLAPQIDRYLTLQPEDEKVRILAGRVRDHVGAKVREALAAAEYEQAGLLLQNMPLSAMDEATQKLQSDVRELNRLNSELRYAPHADGGLLTIAQRLVQLAPQDTKVPKLVAELKKRLQQGPADRRFPIIPWAPAPSRPQFDPPVDWLGGFHRLRGANSTVDDGLRRQAGAFFVAAGLALQGLGQARITINLVPPVESTSLLGKLGRFRKTPTIQSAWGLDIGGSALKAIKLGIADSPAVGVTILASDCIPHRLNLATPEAETQRAEIIRESLQVWRERHQPAGDETICVNGQATKILGRFFQIPTVKHKKIAELVTYEATQQIPFPLADLSWGYQVLNPLDPQDEREADPGELRAVVVAAMRSSDTRDQLQPFVQLDLSVHTLQAETLALYNFLSFDHFAADSAGDSAEGANCIALLDVGSDAANLVICSRDRIWFRTLRCGGNDVNLALTREFKLTFAQAEEVKRQLGKARRLGALLETLDQPLAKLVGETQRSLEAFNKEQPDQRVDRLWVCGGAAHQYGLLRYCRSGSLRSRD